jgi:predicted metal-dependent phosphotriesterase family hydrolase
MLILTGSTMKNLFLVFLTLSFSNLFTGCKEKPLKIITVAGSINSSELGITLPHEHILVDFIGADSIRSGRYHADSVVAKALPFLLELKKMGCQTLIECTPNYLGRDASLLQRLSRESGLNIVTNTGYYGAAQQKFLPAHVYTEGAEQLAHRWIDEFEKGIDNTGIKPGFMKLSADNGPLTEAQKKIIKASAIAHLKTGLTVAVHSGNGAAAREELSILKENGVAPEAFVWVHAQNEKDFSVFKELGDQGAWVEFDSVNPESIDQYVGFLQFMKEQKLLHRTLLSHDSGWYHVGEVGGGYYGGYITLFAELIPRLRKVGFSESEIDQMTRKNPAEAFSVRVRKLR